MEESNAIHKQNRDIMVDVCKGLGIFFMLWGHCIQYSYPVNKDFYLDPIFKFIYSFHMPFLMMISGYLFELSASKTTNKLFERKCVFLVRSIIGGSIFLFFMKSAIFEMVKGNFTILIDGKWMDNLWDLWFLWSVLSITTFFCIFKVCFKKNNLLVELMLLLIGFFFVMAFPHWQSNVFMYPFFAAGYLYCKYKEKLKSFHFLRYPVLVLFPTMLLFYRKEHYIYTSGIIGHEYSVVKYLYIDCFRYLIGFLGCIFIFTIVYWIKPCIFQSSNKCIHIYNIGRNSLQIYVLSVVFLSSYFPKIRNILSDHFSIMGWTESLLSRTIITFIITIFYVWVLNQLTVVLYRLKIGKFIFGR